MHYDRRFPATINAARSAALVRDVASSAAHGLQVVHHEPSMGGEDFAFMLQSVPGCYFWLGAGGESGFCGLHSPRYDFNDSLLPIGVSLWVDIVRRSLIDS